MKSSQDLTVAKTEAEYRELVEATSLRQAAEWGMRAIEGSMPRLKDKIHYEPEEETNTEREVIMQLVPLIYNFRLEKVGLNQIRNTYVTAWSVDAKYLIN